MTFDTQILLSAELHSIKNQMQALLDSQSELAEAMGHDLTHKPLLDRVQENGQQLNKKLIELITVLKIRDTAFEPSIEEHWIADTLELLEQDITPLAEGANIQQHADPDLNGYYDEQLVTIAVHNALLNSVQAGASNINIAVDELEHGGLNIHIRDDGPGFSDDILNQTSFHIRGTDNGLGLYLMEQAMAAHNKGDVTGKLTLSNDPNGGAVASLFIP